MIDRDVVPLRERGLRVGLDETMRRAGTSPLLPLLGPAAFVAAVGILSRLVPGFDVAMRSLWSVPILVLFALPWLVGRVLYFAVIGRVVGLPPITLRPWWATALLLGVGIVLAVAAYAAVRSA